MFINKITIKNFRSIESAEITTDKFNIFVGQNNHGKTNFFEALKWFFRGPVRGEGLDVIRFRGAPEDDEISVEVEFSGAQEGAQKMKNETKQDIWEEFVEKGANLEHKRWSRWQKYLHSLCIKNNDGSLTITKERVKHWEREITTPYSELTEELKEYDRKETRNYLPLIQSNFISKQEIRDVIEGLKEEKPFITSEESEAYMYSLAQFNRVAGVNQTLSTLKERLKL